MWFVFPAGADAVSNAPLTPPAAPPTLQMMHLPVWFKTLVYSEIYLQLPFFFVATYAFVGERLLPNQPNCTGWPALRWLCLAVTTHL